MKLDLLNRPTKYRKTSEFTIHEAIADDARLAPKDPRYLRMKRAWDEQGGCPTVYATADCKIADGRHRFWWMEEKGLKEIPYIEITEEEVPLVILGAITGRNHVSKSQIAYLSAPKLEQAYKASIARRTALINAGDTTKLPVLPKSDDLAEQLGISAELLRQARRIHEYFADGKIGAKLRKEWEPKILAEEDPVNLGFALAGIAGSVSTKGKPKKPVRNSSVAKVLSAFKNIVQPFAKFDRWADEDRARAVVAMDESLSKLPDSVLETLGKAISAVKRRKKDAATQD